MEKQAVKLLKKIILVSIPLIAIVAAAFLLPMSYMSQEYVIWEEERNYVNYPEHTAPALIIGDSRAKSSILPDALTDDKSIYNIAIGGATPIEMYYAVKNHIKNNGAPKQAVIIFAPYHFCDIDNWDQTLYNNYLSISEITEVYKKAVEFNDPVILKDGWLTDSVAFRLRLPNKYLAQMYEARFIGYRARNWDKFNSIRSESGYCEYGSEPGNDGESYEVHHEYFDSSPIVLYYFDRLLGLLIKNNADVTILQAPINETSSERIKKDFVDGYFSYLEEVEKKYGNITVMKEIPTFENEYFGDNNHLNRRGAEKYTDMIRGQQVFKKEK